MLILKSRLKIVATLLIKNEEDIIATNIEHHINQGVSHFIITDNASVDNTRSIVAKYPEVVEIIDEPGKDHRQSEWVTRMARMACKYNPDWIIHLDGDELWGGLCQLQDINKEAAGCTTMYLHPPTSGGFKQMQHYLDFDNINLPGECKIAHRPHPNIQITHGNHSCNLDTEYTTKIWRHHYPVRSFTQFVRKSVEGHKALASRNAPCERWQRWFELHQSNKLEILYNQVCATWEKMQLNPNTESLTSMMEFWSTPDVIELFRTSRALPKIGKWPKICVENALT